MPVKDPQVAQRMLDRERIRGASRMFPEGTTPSQVSDEQERQLAHNVNAYAKAAGLSRVQVGKAIGYTGGVISEFINGKYRGDVKQVAIDLDAWLEAEYRRQETPETVRFVWTAVAREMKMLASYAQQMRKIVLAYGPETSGIGKTWALQALRDVLPGSILVTVDKVHANQSGLLKAISRAMHLNDGRANSALYDRIVTELSGTPRLMMIDQIHNLRGSKGDRPLFTLTDLWDRTGAPQLWAGTSDMVEYLNRGVRKGEETLAQIRSRIGLQWDLMERTRNADEGGRGEPLVTLDEIRRAFGSNKIRLATGAERFLLALACLPDGGAMRTCEQVVTFATILAAAAGEATISEGLIREACRRSMPASKFQLFDQRLRDEQPRMMGLAAAG